LGCCSAKGLFFLVNNNNNNDNNDNDDDDNNNNNNNNNKGLLAFHIKNGSSMLSSAIYQQNTIILKDIFR